MSARIISGCKLKIVDISDFVYDMIKLCRILVASYIEFYWILHLHHEGPIGTEMSTDNVQWEIKHLFN